MLQPGVCAPELVLTPADHTAGVSPHEAGGKIVLLFLPASPSESLRHQLAQYEAQAAAFRELDSHLIAVSEAPAADLEQLAGELHLGFPLVSDPERQNWQTFAQASPEQPVEPTAFLIEDEGRIRAIYDATRYPNLPGPKSIIRAIRQLNDMLKPAPISEQDWKMGPLDAPVAIIEYSDYQCHHCRETAQLLEQLVGIYGEQVVIVHRHLPLRQAHPLAQQAAEAAEAAGAQGKFWEMHRSLFAAKGNLPRDVLSTCAAQIGLDTEWFNRELDGRVYQERVNRQVKSAVECGVRLPPTLFINSVVFKGPRTLEALCSRIAGLLSGGAQDSARQG